MSDEEIRFFITGYAREEIPDYQMSALAMAILFRGMSFEEVTVLTDIMMRSGEMVDTSTITIPKADKHSTGGVGDKVSLVLAPLAACCGIAVPMISGRGLGITGGTLDKFESIPGYRTDLSVPEFLEVLQECGCSIIGQTAELAPADKKLYALRDVTGTVPSIPLIAASIMSKKLAEGTDALVLDVKWGKGAFMKTTDDARELARTMVEIGNRMGKKMAAPITDMNQPLGCTAGNAVEIAETIAALKGQGPADLMTVTMHLTAQMLVLCRKAETLDDAMTMLRGHIDSGAAFERFKKMVVLHGGRADVIDNPSLLPTASTKSTYKSLQAGYVAGVDAEQIGKACVVLGAGRRQTTDTVDHAVGVTGIVKIGDSVDESDPLLTIHANDSDRLVEAERLLTDAFTFSQSPPDKPNLILA